MAKFEHRRYHSLVLHDGKQEWARFSPEERTYGEHTLKVGVLDTEDPGVIARLAEATDPDLVWVDKPADWSPGVDIDDDGVPEGSTAQVMAWVNDAENDAERKRRVVAAFNAEGDRDQPRKGLLADLEKLGNELDKQ